jgi:aspartate/methionine/tyrosine aminotransferase
MKKTNAILGGLETTIFEVMSALAVEHGAVNLGQGFPDTDGPEDIRRTAADAIIEGPNQYPRMLGLPELRSAVAEHDRRFYGLDVDPDREVMVTSGATEALADCLFGLIEPGDEVVLIEPVYDTYLPVVRLAGGVPRIVRLEPPDWALPEASLEAAFSPATKLIVLNSPHNPVGKVFTESELEHIARLVVHFDAFAVCDEVYEHLVFGGARHRPLITMPGMRERCLRVGSAGKTFSLTGWKVGYVIAPPALLTVAGKAHQYLTFTTAPNLQRAVAYGLGKDDAYFASLADDMAKKRDRLIRGLASVGFEMMDSAGTYFVCADFRSLGFNGTDEAFCRHITEHAGVAAVPLSAFYENADVDRFVRFCFCKQDHVLDEAIERLGRHFASA